MTLEQLLTKQKTRLDSMDSELEQYATADLLQLGATALYSGPNMNPCGPLGMPAPRIGTYSNFTTHNTSIGNIRHTIPLEKNAGLQERFDFKDKPHINYELFTGKSMSKEMSKGALGEAHKIDLNSFDFSNNILKEYRRRKKLEQY